MIEILERILLTIGTLHLRLIHLGKQAKHTKNLRITQPQIAICPQCGFNLWIRRTDGDWNCKHCGYFALDL